MKVKIAHDALEYSSNTVSVKYVQCIYCIHVWEITSKLRCAGTTRRDASEAQAASATAPVTEGARVIGAEIKCFLGNVDTDKMGSRGFVSGRWLEQFIQSQLSSWSWVERGCRDSCFCGNVFRSTEDDPYLKRRRNLQHVGRPEGSYVLVSSVIRVHDE